MRKKSIAVVFAAGIVSLLCVFSPLFVPEFQNRRMLGKVYQSAKGNDGVNRTKISLLQKIELFQKQMQKENRDESFDGNMWMSDKIGMGLQELVAAEILPIELEAFSESDGSDYAYWIPTDGKDNHILIWKTVINGEKNDGFYRKPYVILWVEQETGKIIGFKARWSSFSGKNLPDRKTLAKKWCTYLGQNAEMKQKNETNYEYRQGDAVVEYEIIMEKDEYKIVPMF